MLLGKRDIINCHCEERSDAAISYNKLSLRAKRGNPTKSLRGAKRRGNLNLSEKRLLHPFGISNDI